MTAVNLLSSLSASTLAHVQLVIHIEARDSFLIADFIKSHLTPSLSVDFLNLVLYDLSSYIIICTTYSLLCFLIPQSQNLHLFPGKYLDTFSTRLLRCCFLHRIPSNPIQPLGLGQIYCCWVCTHTHPFGNCFSVPLSVFTFPWSWPPIHAFFPCPHSIFIYTTHYFWPGSH